MCFIITSIDNSAIIRLGNLIYIWKMEKEKGFLTNYSDSCS